MRKLIALLGLLALLTMCALPALAADVSLYYFSGSAETSFEDEDGPEADAAGYGAELNFPVYGPVGVRLAYDDVKLEDITDSDGEPLLDEDCADRLELGAKKLGIAATYSFDLAPVKLQVFGGWSQLDANAEFDLTDLAEEGDIEVEADRVGCIGSITASGKGSGYEIGAEAEYAFTDKLKVGLGASYMPDFDLDGSIGFTDLHGTDIDKTFTINSLLEDCSATDIRAQLEYAFNDSFSIFGGYKWFSVKGDLRDFCKDDRPKAVALVESPEDDDPWTAELTKQGWFLGGKFAW